MVVATTLEQARAGRPNSSSRGTMSPPRVISTSRAPREGYAPKRLVFGLRPSAVVDLEAGFALGRQSKWIRCLDSVEFSQPLETARVSAVPQGQALTAYASTQMSMQLVAFNCGTLKRIPQIVHVVALWGRRFRIQASSALRDDLGGARGWTSTSRQGRSHTPTGFPSRGVRPNRDSGRYG